MNRGEAIMRFRGVMRRRGLAWKTEQTYVGWLERYMRWLASADPLPEDSRGRIEGFLTHLASRERVSGKTQNQAFNALICFYRHALNESIEGISALRARVGHRQRHAPSLADVAALLERVQDRNGYPVRLIVRLLYGCGLRVSEPLNLRIKDIRFDTDTLHIREAKGDKDRTVRIPAPLKPALRAQIIAARARYAEDQAAGVRVTLPGAYGRKHSSAAREWGWYWLFPQHAPCKHPRTGKTVRYHLHESNIQRAVREARRAAGIAAPLSPHHLRHAYATHLHQAGVTVRDLQAVLGHKSLETTMVYITPQAQLVRSPLELLEKTA